MTTFRSTGLRINIRPEVTILSVLRHLNYRPWFAIAEFVDNSLQSFVANRQALEALHGPDFRLCVRVGISNQEEPIRIVVTDNAAGIAIADFPRAFRPAQIPPDRTGLSEFGMGMKSAACWFANNWQVRTSALGEVVERSVSFRIDEIVQSGTEEIAVVERQMGTNEHFTEVVLEDLTHPPKGRTVGKIKEHLASIYRVFIRSGSLELIFNGEPLIYQSPKILVAPPYRTPRSNEVEWTKDISLDFGGGQKVTGFAALRDTASTTHAGFALFRRDRLIEGSADETYRPIAIFGNSNSYRYQRLFGELHLEGFEVSHTKDGFRWEEYEDEFLDLLKEEIERSPINLLDQAEGFRAKQYRDSIGQKAERASTAVAAVVERDLAAVIDREEVSPSTPKPIPISLTPPAFQITERKIVVPIRSGTWTLLLRITDDPAQREWLEVGERRKLEGDHLSQYELDLTLSLAHPFSVRFLGPTNDNIEVFIRIAAAYGLSLRLGDAAGKIGYLHYFNELLRDPFSNPQ